MRLRSEWAHLVIGSKTGVGVQGDTNKDRLDATADRLLVLDPDLNLYLPRFGSRCWLRVMHSSDNWKDPVDYARHAADRIADAYQYGCRDGLTGNEQIALEGLGDSAHDYRWLNWWGVEHLRALRSELQGRGIYDFRIWGPALSPGHAEDDGFEGYRLLAEYLQALDGIAVHNYWGPDFGFLDDWDFEWWAGRIQRAHALIEGDLGIVKPWAITEFNRKVDRGHPDNADVIVYANECKRYYQWINSLDYVVAAFTFLYCNTDPGFDDLTWERMPGMVERMNDGWDRQSEGEWATPPAPEVPQVGDGFRKFEALIGPFLEDETHHFGETDHQVSMAVGVAGYATWSRRTNTTVAHCNNGEIWSDLGNVGDGSIRRLHP